MPHALTGNEAGHRPDRVFEPPTGKGQSVAFCSSCLPVEMREAQPAPAVGDHAVTVDAHGVGPVEYQVLAGRLVYPIGTGKHQRAAVMNVGHDHARTHEVSGVSTSGDR